MKIIKTLTILALLSGVAFGADEYEFNTLVKRYAEIRAVSEYEVIDEANTDIATYMAAGRTRHQAIYEILTELKAVESEGDKLVAFYLQVIKINHSDLTPDVALRTAEIHVENLIQKEMELGLTMKAAIAKLSAR